MTACCQGYFPDRGTVRYVNGYQPGLFAVDGLQFPGLLINSIQYSPQELIAPKVSINGSKVIYTFGSDYGTAAVNGEVLLGSSCSSNEAVARIINYYQSNRISAKKGPINLSAGGKGIKIYVTGMAIGQTDPEFNIISFGISGLLAEPRK